MPSYVTGKSGPLPKPPKREPKPPQPLQRKTPLRAYKTDKNGIRILSPPKARKVSVLMSPDEVERDRQLKRIAKLNLPPREKYTFRQVEDEWRNVFTEVKWAWKMLNPPDYDGGYYQCALCPYAVHEDVVTLDHIKPRSTSPHLLYDFQNLQAAHYICNSRKGSMSMEAYHARYPAMQTSQSRS